MEPVEGTPNVRVIVDTNHYLALATAHEIGHAFVLLEREVDAVAGGLPVRRIHVKECVRTVIALSAGEPREILNVGAGEALPRSG
ncbi:hypothetical protein D3C76_1353900 [compost metagenome]